MRKIPFAGIELTSQRVRGYMVPLSYRGDRLYREVEFCVLTIESFSTNYWAFVFGQNGQKRELPVLFWPKTGVPGNNSGRECWSYLIGQPPLPPDFGQKRPGTPGNSYFTQLPPVFGHFMFLSDDGLLDYSNRSTWATRRIKCHEEVLYLQPLIQPKRFDIFPPLTGGCSEGLGAF